jgi:HD-like signal output (HDOD) protein
MSNQTLSAEQSVRGAGWNAGVGRELSSEEGASGSANSRSSLMLNHDEIIRLADQLEPLPPSCARLAGMVTQEDPDLLEVSEIFRQDPVLTAKLLRLANSAAYGAPRTIGTVKEAVVRLGSVAVFGLAVGVASRPKLDTRIPGYDLAAGELWRHSLAAAMTTNVLTIYLSGRIPPLAFASSLLHDVGKLVLGRMLTTDLQRGCQLAVDNGGLQPFEAETEILSVHHGEVSGIIAQRWQLPDGIVNGVTHHHDPLGCDDPHALVTFLTNVVARKIEGNPLRAPGELETFAAAIDRIGLAESDFEKIEKATAARLSEIGPLYG